MARGNMTIPSDHMKGREYEQRGNNKTSTSYMTVEIRLILETARKRFV
jgi:hypothetical protein